MLIKVPFNKTLLGYFVRPYQVRDKNILCFKFGEIVASTDNLFDCVTSADLESLKNDNTFVLIDVSPEGFSFKEFEIFSRIHKFFENTNFSFDKIFYVSSNLYEEKNYNDWLLENNLSRKINILTVSYWDWNIKNNFSYRSKYNEVIKSIDNKNYFLCLNRRIRVERSFLIYKLFESSFYNKINISFDRIKREYFNDLLKFIDFKTLDKLIDASPSILDIKDFSINQAGSYNKELYDNTIISLVAETLQYSYNKTSLFYSEKTFKPMCFYHPVLIFGQPYANKKLFDIGYKTYDCYFNLEFDEIENLFDRYTKQINFLSDLSNNLNKMTRSQKQDWFEKGKEVLVHNQEMMNEQYFNKRQSLKFLNLINQK